MATPDHFDAYFRRADVDGDGRISGREAVSFFRGANLRRDVLAKIWGHANKEGTGFLSKSEFYDALKLVSVAQTGRELTSSVVKRALSEPAASQIPAPLIQFSSSFPAQAASAPPLHVAFPGGQGGQGFATPKLAADVTKTWPKMTDAIVQSYTKTFFETDPDMDGKISGIHARNIFCSWQIPQEVLKEIWDLSDQDRDGMLSLREFCVACYLMERHRENCALPSAVSSALCFDESGAEALSLFEAQVAVAQNPAGQNVLPCQKNPEPLSCTPASLEAMDSTQEKAMFFFDTDVLDCEVCMEVLTPPIYQCENGHYACLDCLEKMNSKCHVCRSLICKTNRNLGLEKILQTLRSKCMFSDQGCNRMLAYIDAKKHEKSCWFSPHNCPLSGCSFHGPFNGMSAHFKDSHNVRTINFSDGNRFVIPSFDPAHEQHLLLVGTDLPFLLCCHDYPKLGKILYISSFCFNAIQSSQLLSAPDMSGVAYTYDLCVYNYQDAQGLQFRLKGASVKNYVCSACVNVAVLSAEGIDFLLIPKQYAFNTSRILVEVNPQQMVLISPNPPPPLPCEP